MNKPTTKQTNQTSRRRLLGALTLGAASAKLPELWTRPVVDSVLLPAHAVTTNEMRVSGGGGGVATISSVLPLLDSLVPTAHATGSNYPGCASFEWITNTDGSSWQPDSLRLILLTMKCPKEAHLYQVLANLPMVHVSGNTYAASGDGDWDVRLEMIKPLARPGEHFGHCSVRNYNSFRVYRGETCSADHPDEASCSGDTCKVVDP